MIAETALEKPLDDSRSVIRIPDNLPTNTLAAALPYAAEGINVLPIDPQTKHAGEETSGAKTTSSSWSRPRTPKLLCLDKFDAEWIVGSRPNPPAPRPRDWMQSIATFIRQGPRSAAAPNLMDIALKHNRIGKGDRWRYFRGCCWRRIRERQVVVTFTPAPGVHNSGDLS